MFSDWLNLLAVFGGPILLGLMLFYGMKTSDRRRENPVAEARSEQGTENLYEAEERDLRRDEERKKRRA